MVIHPPFAPYRTGQPACRKQPATPALLAKAPDT